MNSVNSIDLAIIVICLALLINKSTREGAVILIAAKLIYTAFIIGTSMTVYFSLTAGINLAAALSLQYIKYKIPALCAFILVIVNTIGYILWSKGFSPDLHNVVSVIILFIQLIAISTRLLTHGRSSRDNYEYPLAFPHGFNSNQACDTIDKTVASKKQ